MWLIAASLQPSDVVEFEVSIIDKGTEGHEWAAKNDHEKGRKQHPVLRPNAVLGMA